MTTLELLVTKLSKTQFNSLDDYINLINRVNIIKKNKVSINAELNIDSVMKNYRIVANRRNKKLAALLRDLYDMFVDLNSQDIFAKYIIWWTYTIHKDKWLQKYKQTDILNDTLMNSFIEWLEIYVNNIKVLTEFNKSCKFISSGCNKNTDAEDVIADLIKRDKLSVAYMTGGLSPYALATIPNSIVKTFNFKNSPFSQQLFTMIDNSREYLLGILNQACENVIKTPVDFILYVNTIFRYKDV